jgi:hypothetical protein
MWKLNWVAAKLLTINLRFSLNIVCVGLGFAILGCSADATPFVEPTQTLIPATSTFTPAPVTPTLLQATLPSASDLENATADSDVASTTSDSENLLDVDPVASELAALAQRRIAEDLGLPTRRVRIVEVTSYIWPDTSLGCPVPGETYTAQIVDGYRILLSAGDNEYIFHTDFDRAVPCDSANEQLPEVTPESPTD